MNAWPQTAADWMWQGYRDRWNGAPNILPNDPLAARPTPTAGRMRTTTSKASPGLPQTSSAGAPPRSRRNGRRGDEPRRRTVSSIRPLQELRFAREIEFSADLGDRGDMTWVALQDLVIDDRYQRPIEARGRKTVRRIIEEFSWAKFEPIIIAPADGAPGKFAILDGQHRATAALIHPRVSQVPAIIHEIGLAEQARAFRDINSVVTNMTPLAIHYAGVVGGDPDALFIERVCKAADVVVCRYPKAAGRVHARETMAVGMIGKLLALHGEQPVRRALTALRKAYPEVGGVLRSPFIRALALVSAARPALSSGELAEVIGDSDLDTLWEAARSRLKWGGKSAGATIAGEFASDVNALFEKRLERVAA